MPIQFLTLFLSWLPFLLLAQSKETPLRPKTAALADSLANIGKVEIKGAEFIHPPAKQLIDSSSIHELVILTRSAHPAVRIYAWAGLLQKKEVSSELMFQVVREHWYDCDSVQMTYFNGYDQNPFTVVAGDYILRNFGAFSGSVALTLPKVFTPDQATALKFDSLLICEPPPFQNLYLQALRYSKANPNWYDCARRQLLDEHNILAVMYLSKFKKEADIDLIVRHLLPQKPGDLSMRLRWVPFLEFQHPKLFQVLKDSAATNFTDPTFLQAILKYQNREAADLIDSIFCRALRSPQKSRQSESIVCMAFHGKFDTVFADVFIKMLCQAPENTNCRIPEILWECRPDTLAALYEIWKNGGKGARQRATAMFPQYEKWLSAQGPEKNVLLVMEQIKPGGRYREFQKAFAAILKTRGRTVFVDALFDLLQREPLPENRFFLAKLLLDLQVPEVKMRLEKLFAENPSLRPTLVAAEKAGSMYADFLHHAKNNED